jgi:diguanylate cyclase (GGDEF)-like protein
MKRLSPKNRWQFLLVAVGAAIAFTAVMNSVQSLIWYGHISRDLLIIGTIDAVVVSLIVAPWIVHNVLTDRKRIERELHALSITDDLTGLNNRRGFFYLAEQLLKISSRNKTGMYLLYTDLDDFKDINDDFGHGEGDRALQAYAQLLKENYRESDIVSRIGGDEFAILPVGTSKDGINVIMTRFLCILSHYNETSGHRWKLSASVGVAYYDPASPSSVDELLRQADASMYRQKNHRKTPGAVQP